MKLCSPMSRDVKPHSEYCFIYNAVCSIMKNYENGGFFRVGAPTKSADFDEIITSLFVFLGDEQLSKIYRNLLLSIVRSWRKMDKIH